MSLATSGGPIDRPGLHDPQVGIAIRAHAGETLAGVLGRGSGTAGKCRDCCGNLPDIIPFERLQATHRPERDEWAFPRKNAGRKSRVGDF